VLGPIDPLPLQPFTDDLDRAVPGMPSGWSEVKAWCQRVQSLEEYFNPSIGDPIDLLVIVLDLDIAVRAGVQKAPASLKAYDAKALCSIVKSWLPAPLRWPVVIAIPITSIESWIVAALFPKRKVAPELERAPSMVLLEKKKIPRGDSGPWKRVVEYRAFADAVAARLGRVRASCREADRFVKKLNAIAPRLRLEG
jgi:hypothetical protein